MSPTGQAIDVLLVEDDPGDVLMTQEAFERDGRDIAERGLYLDVPRWGYHVFHLSAPE